ncbi:MAG: cytidylate kinase family protein [Acidobacteriia bacterium]|nr:cytidylate kinase family protein [Terriglobia bacterium]
MSIIAVSEEGFSGGQEFAKTLAENLGCRYVDSAILVERAAAWGGDRKKLRAAFENAPGFLDRFLRDPEIQVLLLQAALAEDIREGNVVCYGIAADLLNLEARQILRVRVEASRRFRNLRVQERLKLPREEAETHLNQGDRNQRRWQSYLFSIKVASPRGYDFLVNLEQTTSDEACTAVSDLISSQSRFRPSTTDTALVERFAVSSRIRAALAQNPPTAHLDLDVEIEDRTAVLRGMVRSVEEIDSLKRFVFPIPGDLKVDVNQVQLGSWDYQPPLFSSEAEEAHTPKPSKFWAPVFPRPAWLLAGASAMILLVLAGSHAPGRWFHPADTRLLSFAGVITDSECGLSHKIVQKTAECVRSCVKLPGAKYVLNDGTHNFVLTDQQQAERFAAQKVVATGLLDEITGDLQLRSIQAVAN